MTDTNITEANSAQLELPLSDDIIDGVTGKNGYASFTGWSIRRCYYLLKKGFLPGGKLGGRWIGSKCQVRAHISKLASGDVG